MLPWITPEVPDYSSRGPAPLPPPDRSRQPRLVDKPARNAGQVKPAPQQVGITTLKEPVYDPKFIPTAKLPAAPALQSTLLGPASDFSPSLETYPTLGRSYFAPYGSGGGGGGGVTSLNTLSGDIVIGSNTLSISLKDQEIAIEAPPLVGSLNGLNNDLTITSTTATITPDAITNTIAIEIPPGAGGVANLNSLIGSVALTSTDGTIAITTGTLNSIDFSAAPSVAGVASLNSDTGDIVLTSTGGSITISKAVAGEINLEAVASTPAAWSTYAATSTIEASHYDINGSKDIYCESIHGIGTAYTHSPALQVLADDSIYIAPGSLTNVLTPAKCQIQTTGGSGGVIELIANPGGPVGLEFNPGTIKIEANPTITGAGNAGIGGTVSIIANSAVGLDPLLTQTSKVVTAAASILSYAGYYTPGLSTAGYNYVYGTNGVNIMADIVPPIVPNFLGTVYLYGRTGVAVGTASLLGTDYGLFAGLIQPYSDGVSRPDLYIMGKYTAKVRIQDVSQFVGSSLNLEGISQINSVPYVPTQAWSAQAATQPVDFANFNLANVTTINGAPYPPAGPPGTDWWTVPAGGTVDMSGNNITNLVNINGAPYVSGANWWLYPPTASLNMGAQDIYNANDITAANGEFTGLVEGNIVGINNVVQIGYITKDTPGTGIQINSDNDISLLVGTALGAPPGKVSNTGYYTTDILVPTNANELTTKQYVDGRSGVVSLNSLTGALSITAGAGITVTPSGSSVEIAMTQGPIRAYGNNTISVSAITTAAQNIGILGGITTIGTTSRLVANATMTVLTNSNTTQDITYYITLNGAQIGAQMKHSFNGVGHWNTLAVTAISTTVPASTTNVIRLVALASVTATFTVTAMNLNCTVDLA